jgi:hypothetical protein
MATKGTAQAGSSQESSDSDENCEHSGAGDLSGDMGEKVDYILRPGSRSSFGPVTGPRVDHAWLRPCEFAVIPNYWG